MSDAQWFDGAELEKIRFPYTDFVAPANPPESNLNIGPFRKLCINAEWAKYVVGALARMLKPDAWEGDQANIDIGILAIEAMIAQLAINYEICETPPNGNGNGASDPPPPNIVYVGGDVIESEDNMGQVVTEVKLSEDGTKLQIFYGHCCMEELDLTALKVPGDPGIGNPLDDPDDALQVWYPCGKATGLVDALAAMITTGLQYYTAPAEFAWRVRNSVQAVDMTTSALYLLLFDFVTITKTVQNDTIINDDLVAWMKCKIAPTQPDTADVSVTDFETAIQVMKSVIYEQIDSYVAANLVWTLWEQCYQAIGPLDCVLLMKLGAASPSNCACPGEVEKTATSVNGWYWQKAGDYPFEYKDNFENTFLNSVIQAQEDLYGVAIRITSLSNAAALNKYKRSNDPQDAYNIYMFGTNSDSWSSTKLDWHCQVDPDIATEVLALLDGTAYNHTPQFVSTDIVNVPTAQPGAIVLATYNFGSSSGDHTGEAEVWWLYNENSPSQTGGAYG